MRRLLALAALLVVLTAAPAGAQEFPGFSAPVVDAADVVPVQIEQRVNAQLLDYQERSGNQIAVAVIDTTGDQSIDDYSEDLFDEWGVGDAEEDNGILLVIAIEDRQLRIEVGFGLEGDFTDAAAGRVRRDHITPRLQAGDYGGAIEVGTQEIRRVLGDDQVGAPPATVAPAQDEPSGGGFPTSFLIFGLIFLVSTFLGGSRRRGRRWGVGGPIIWGGGFGGGLGGGGFGGGGFGGGGGGFGGGGGGGSGGGGSSGGW